MKQNNQKENHSLLVTQIIHWTLEYGWLNRLYIFNALKYPSLSILFLSLLTYIIPNEGNIFIWLIIILEVYFYTIFAVRCHRVVLLSEPPKDFKSIFKWKERNTNFLLASFGVGVVTGICAFVPIIFLIPLSSIFSDLSWYSHRLIVYIFIIPSGYIFSRVSLVLPAAAIESDDSFTTAWAISAKNGWKLFVLIAAIPGLFHIILEIIDQNILILNVASALIGLIVLSFEIMVLSHSFKELNKLKKDI